MIIIYESTLDLIEKLRKNLDTGESGVDNEFIFFKCVYLIDNIGFYLYYKSISSYPSIAIKGWDGNSVKTYKNYETFTLEKYSLNANYLVYYEIIKAAHEEGYKIVDLFGTCGDANPEPSNPIYGIHNFKKRLGGEYCEFIGEFYLPVNKFIYRIYMIYKKYKDKKRNKNKK